MQHSRRIGAMIAAVVVSGLALSGCSAPKDPAGAEAGIQVVATTNVYGDIASRVGGSLVEVDSVISNPSQDPHSYEASPRIQLALSRADVVIENGGGYDDWADRLLSGATSQHATVLNVSDLSGYDQDPAEGEFNEHVWYDFPTIEKLVHALADAFAKLDAVSAQIFRANADAFIDDLDGLEQREETLKSSFAGTGVAITEPVPLYLLGAIGLENVTPEDFSEAVEEGTDVPPLALSQTLALFGNGSAKLLVYNAQTSGPGTEQLIAAATAEGAPVVPVTETMPANTDYLGWMTANLDAIEAALR